ncbi:hypothetical protein IJT93_01760 [bacterium]|nr:hypothetical protein [bacterium]
MTEEHLKNAMEALQKAFRKLSKEEIQVVKNIQKECAQAKEAGTVEDERLEFCYCVKMSTDLINNEELTIACDAYIEASRQTQA